MKQRLLVMNGQRIVQIEQEGAWINQKVDKAEGIGPGIYNLYTAQQADKSLSYDGLIVHVDSNVYQQTGKNFVMHVQPDFDEIPETGRVGRISYDAQGKAIVSPGNVKNES